MKLTRRFRMHMRLQRGAIVVYDVMLDGAVVGQASIRIDKKTVPWTERVSYGIDDRTFDSLAEFKAAVANTNGKDHGE